MIVECAYCYTSFNKTNSEIKKSKSGNHFCSRSCSASLNNAKNNNPKRRPKKACVICTRSVRTKLDICHKCNKDKFPNINENSTLEQMIAILNDKGWHSDYWHSRIRQKNRLKHKKLTKLPCYNCGYDKHVHLCHIKPVSQFPITATIKQVNSSSNVVQLCPNCHWEFDNGFINIIPSL